MQNQKKQFIGIFIVLVILIAAYFGLRFYNQMQEEKEQEEENLAAITVTSLTISDITAFSYQVDGETLSFRKDGDAWLFEDDTTLDLDEDTIESMLTRAAAITASEEVTEPEDLSEYGLDNPSNTISMTTDAGVTTLYLGNENDILSQYYLKTGDGDSVYLIDTSLTSVFSKTVEDLIAEEEETETEEAETEEVETEETESEETQPEETESEEVESAGTEELEAETDETETLEETTEE